jgi:hypothetical protein
VVSFQLFVFERLFLDFSGFVRKTGGRDARFRGAAAGDRTTMDAAHAAWEATSTISSDDELVLAPPGAGGECTCARL